MNTKLAPILLSLLLLSSVRAGTILQWGEDFLGEANVPDGNDYIAIAAGHFHGLAVKSDGTLKAWGWNKEGQCNVPDGNDFVAVAAGLSHSVFLRSDGTITAIGENLYGECDVTGNGWVEIDAVGYSTVARKADGSVTYWGYGGPMNETDCIKIRVGSYSNALGLRTDGTLFKIGTFDHDLPSGTFTDIDFSGKDAIAANDTDIIAFGENWGGQNDFSEPNGEVLFVGCAISHNVIITTDDTNNINQYGQAPWQPPTAQDIVALDIEYKNNMILTSELEYTLTILTDPPGLDCGVGAGSHYAGKRVLIDAPDCPDCPAVYTFGSWDIGGSKTQYVAMDTNKTITAVYTEQPKKCGDLCHPILQGDMNKDCYVNFEDFAIYALQWLDCTHPDCD